MLFPKGWYGVQGFMIVYPVSGHRTRNREGMVPERPQDTKDIGMNVLIIAYRRIRTGVKRQQVLTVIETKSRVGSILR